MTAASPPAPPPVGEMGLNGAPVHGHMMNMARFHPIAMNPSSSGPAPPGPPPYRQYGTPVFDQGPPPPSPSHAAPSHHQQPGPPPSQHQPPGPPPSQHQPPGPPPSHHHPPYPGPPGMLGQGPLPPPPGPPAMSSQLDHIEARLRQIEHEEANRAAARAQTLAMRRREDDDFRLVTERAEAEEEDLRRRRKRLKRESMGLTFDIPSDSPPQPAPRRLSETSAATTLAFFKQQSPPEPRQPDIRPPPPPPPAIIQQPTPLMSAATGVINTNGSGTFRKKQKYTIKNAEAWGERHGRPATYDPAGRALWKRISDGRFVYLDCPAPGCGKSDFVTLHGFMCHLTKKHKDRSMGSQSRALDLCGTVYDPDAPRPQRPSLKRGSTEDSRPGSVHSEPEDMDESSGYEDEDSHGRARIKKEDSNGKLAETDAGNNKVNGPSAPVTSSPPVNGSNKPTIAAMIGSNVQPESWRTPNSLSADVNTALEQPARAQAEATPAAAEQPASSNEAPA